MGLISTMTTDWGVGGVTNDCSGKMSLFSRLVTKSRDGPCGRGGGTVRRTGNTVGPHRGDKGESEGRDVIHTLPADEPVPKERKPW